jgi:hypothetical protein
VSLPSNSILPLFLFPYIVSPLFSVFRPTHDSCDTLPFLIHQQSLLPNQTARTSKASGDLTESTCLYCLISQAVFYLWL